MDLARGTAVGIARRDGMLALESSQVTGTWTSDPVGAGFSFDEVIGSWNARTPAAAGLRVELRATGSGRDTKWYALAAWAEEDIAIRRTTFRGQADADGDVNVDTFVRAPTAAPLTSYALRLTLTRASVADPTPTVSLLAAVASVGRGGSAGASGVARDIEVPRYSQETHLGHFPQYAGGGEAWCSPTSMAMILAFWKVGPTNEELARFPGAGHGDAVVDYAARGTYDVSYRGTGNWAFNVAYAARFGLEGYVTRLRSLADAERFIELGIPLVVSVNGALPGFLFGSTDGHLLVVRGFTAAGDVIVNDPAVLSNAQVRKVYARADFERVWLGGAKGTVYIVRPSAVALPTAPAGQAVPW